MTTKVKIEIVQENMPVVVTVGPHTFTLWKRGDAVEDYLHSEQSIHVREMTTAEKHERGLK